MNSDGDGYVSPGDIDDQMQVLHDAFEPAGWNFKLADVNYVTNNDWFDGMEDDGLLFLAHLQSF